MLKRRRDFKSPPPTQPLETWCSDHSDTEEEEIALGSAMANEEDETPQEEETQWDNNEQDVEEVTTEMPSAPIPVSTSNVVSLKKSVPTSQRSVTRNAQSRPKTSSSSSISSSSSSSSLSSSSLSHPFQSSVTGYESESSNLDDIYAHHSNSKPKTRASGKRRK